MMRRLSALGMTGVQSTVNVYNQEFKALELLLKHGRFLMSVAIKINFSFEFLIRER
jgi:hypothetical protein